MGFRFRRAQEVVFGDLDLHGHANNAAYLTFLETARLAYLAQVVGIRPTDRRWIILGDVRISFRSASTMSEVLEIGVRVSRMGRRSIEFDYEARGADGRLVLEGTSIHAPYDYEQQATAAVPASWRKRIEAYEAGSRNRKHLWPQ
jgi:acyl-CoA thioester hydrolase